MVDTKKEQERDELHRAIWAIADELRGAVDGWDFKNYVLGTMFYRYISENLCNSSRSCSFLVSTILFSSVILWYKFQNIVNATVQNPTYTLHAFERNIRITFQSCDDKMCIRDSINCERRGSTVNIIRWR